MAIIHGGNIFAVAREIDCKVSDLLDMSSNLTPLTPDSDLMDVLQNRLHEIAYLPETDSDALRRLFAQLNNLVKDQVAAGNGTTEYIFSIPYVANVQRAIIINPTYSDYQLASARAGLATENFQLRFEDNFKLDLVKLSNVLRGNELVFLCNPNNPTGILTPSEELYAFIKSHPDTKFLVDETYLPFTDEKSLLQFSIPDNLYLLRSFSKIYGIPGLRLGFLISSINNMSEIYSKQKPWGVNRLAQVAGEQLVLHGEKYIKKINVFMKRERPRFIAELDKIKKVTAIPGSANFILCRLSGRINAAVLRQQFLLHRIIIRDCSSFTGLDDTYFRVSLKDAPSNQKCLETLNSILTK